MMESHQKNSVNFLNSFYLGLSTCKLRIECYYYAIQEYGACAHVEGGIHGARSGPGDFKAYYFSKLTMEFCPVNFLVSMIIHMLMKKSPGYKMGSCFVFAATVLCEL